MTRRNLPPLEAGKAYLAADFERFDYFGAMPGESKAILRLHLSNATTIDLPTTPDDLKALLCVLCDAFGPEALAHLKSRNWI